MNNYGYIRLGNQRKEFFVPPTATEKVIYFDRKNPTLGNRHILKNHKDPVERARVIAAFGRDLELDFEKQGPMFKACQELAKKVVNNEQLKAYCYCHPSPCHGNLIIDKVKGMVKAINPAHAWLHEIEPKTMPVTKPTQVGFNFE